MPYQIIYSQKPFGITTIFSGLITDEEIIQSCVDRTSSKEEMQNLKFVKDDLMDVTDFNVTADGIRECALFADKVAYLNKNVAYISIVSSDLLYGMSRMWQTYSADTEWKMNIAKSREEAEIWLKENIK